MIKRLTAVGNSLRLIIERPILELLNIDKETPLEARTDGEALIIRAHTSRAFASSISPTRKRIPSSSSDGRSTPSRVWNAPFFSPANSIRTYPFLTINTSFLIPRRPIYHRAFYW